MTTEKKRRGRPPGSKNKPKPLRIRETTSFRELQDEVLHFIAGEVNRNTPEMIRIAFERAMDDSRSDGWRYYQFLYDKVIPQLKHVEHRGDADYRGGVSITIAETPGKGITIDGKSTGAEAGRLESRGQQVWTDRAGRIHAGESPVDEPDAAIDPESRR